MRNKITDLNNLLFAQLERLDEDDITSEQLEKEAIRSKLIVEVGKTIVESHKNTIEAMKIIRDVGGDPLKSVDFLPKPKMNE